jgi:O-antigen/teichoic acid export membrane protein
MTVDSDSLSVLKGSGIIFSGRVLELGISFLALVIIARFLGRVEYGAVSLGMTTATIVSTVVVLGLHTGVARYLPRSDGSAERRGVLLSAIHIAVPLSVMAGLAVVGFADFIAVAAFSDPAVAPVLRIFGIVIPLSVFVKLASSTMQGVRKPVPRVYIRNLILPVSRFALVALVILLGYKAVGVAWAYLLSYAAGAGIGLYFIWRYTPLFESVTPRYRHRELLSFSWPLVLSAAMAMVFSDLDTLLLGYFSSTGDIGVYRVAYPLATLLLVVLNSFAFMFMPTISDLHSDGEFERMKALYQTVTKWVIVPTLPLFLAVFLFPTSVIGLSFGAEYLEGGLTLSVLSVGFLVHAIAGLNVNTLTAIGQTRVVMANNAIAAILNFSLNLLLIPRYAFLGAAIATTVSYVVLNGLHSGLLFRYTGIHPFSWSALKPAAIAAVLGSVLYLVTTAVRPPDVVSLVGMFAVFLPLYATGIVVLGGIEREELELIAAIEGELGIEMNRTRRIARQYERD